MGYQPRWYRVIAAARYLGVAPWDLATRPAAWIEWAFAAQHAEHVAEDKRRPKG